MSKKCKIKVTHRLPNGDSLTYEAWFKDPSSIDESRQEATRRFADAISSLHSLGSEIAISKTKAELEEEKD
jgi:hypothetical protein